MIMPNLTSHLVSSLQVRTEQPLESSHQRRAVLLVWFHFAHTLGKRYGSPSEEPNLDPGPGLSGSLRDVLAGIHLGQGTPSKPFCCPFKQLRLLTQETL